MELAVGTVIGGRYRLDRMIGEGGMGAVWAATHTITGGRVALKFVKGAYEARDEMRRRFEREARAATLVEHPNVVTIRDIFDHDDTPVIVMDLLQGETLAALLARVGKVNVGEASRLMLPVIAAVGAAHAAGLIHRDLKPENVFLSNGTTGEKVRVLDFGIAKLVRRDVDEFASTAVTQSGTVIGTPAYMAPEQLFGEKDLDYRVDVWAIGVMLYEMLVGCRPVEGENFGQLAKKMLTQPIPMISDARPGLPDDVVALVTRLLARERDDRLRDLREAAEILARHGAQEKPTFGAPRSRPLEDSDQEARVVVSAGTDPNAKTMAFSASGPRRTDPTSDTVLAQTNPRHDTATAHVTTARTSSKAWQGLMLGAVLLLAAGIAATRLIPRNAPVSAPIPIPANPIASPIVTVPFPASVPLPTLSAIPATVTQPTTVASASAPLIAPKVTIKPPKVTPSASLTVALTAPDTIAPPLPSVTNAGGSGLVTKPPF